MTDIMDKAKEAALTMKLGGGIGYDFSTLRPNGANIVSLDSSASGPLSFMDVFDSVCGTVSSAGHRRGAQMAVLRVDHPDIEAYVHAKNNHTKFTNFNTSIGITDEFMEAVFNDRDFDLRFENRVYKTVSAKALWEAIMRSTWDWAEPGVLFIDRINDMNNLRYCETIAATNPCGEQPLPPYGACLLGSWNLVKYIKMVDGKPVFDWAMFGADIPTVVRMMDTVVDVATYPLPQQEEEAKSKRRMGLGITGLANTAERLGLPYGSPKMIAWTEKLLEFMRDECYLASIELAKEKGPFPCFKAPEYMSSGFAKTLPKNIRALIKKHGIRNSHLLSIAPTGTISMAADNVSSGLEPPFALEYTATINFPTGIENVKMVDYAYREWGIKGRTSNDISVMDHVNVLCAATRFIDSACSKTCNVGADVTFDQFKDVYIAAYKGGARGCTTFRDAGKRFGVRNVEEDYSEGTACYIDQETGQKECS